MTRFFARPFQFVFNKVVDFLLGWIEPTIIKVVNDKDNAKRPQTSHPGGTTGNGGTMTQVYDYTPKEEPVPLFDRANVRIVRMEEQIAEMDERITQLEGASYASAEEEERLDKCIKALEAKMGAWEADS